MDIAMSPKHEVSMFYPYFETWFKKIWKWELEENKMARENAWKEIKSFPITRFSWQLAMLMLNCHTKLQWYFVDTMVQVQVSY